METVSDQASKIYILVRGVLKIYILVRGVDVDARLEEEKVEDGIVASTSCVPVKKPKTWKYVFSFFKIIQNST